MNMLPEQLEIWKDVPGYEGLYQVSDQGRVKSFKRYKHGKVLKQGFSTKGYRQVQLSDREMVPRYHGVHRLVALAFIPNPENKPQVNHKDLDKKNNDQENLEWSTGQENVDHYMDKGYEQGSRCGAKNANARLTEREVLLIKLAFDTGAIGLKELSEILDIKHTTLSAIKYGHSWRHIELPPRAA